MRRLFAVLCVGLMGWLWWSCGTSGTTQETNPMDGGVKETSTAIDDKYVPEPSSQEDLPEQTTGGEFVLTSSAFANGQKIPLKYGCEKDGNFKKPSLPLSWSGAPAGTKSFVLVMDDLAPLAQEWIHWVALDIPASTSSLPEGASGSAMPAGAKELQNTWQQDGYGGPCPPTDVHTYRIRLFAMPTATTTVTPADKSSAITQQLDKALGVAELRGTYP